MLIHELTADECVEALERIVLARLACQRDGQPYVVPVHLYFDGERRCWYGFSTVGQKIAWMRANPRVCVEIEDITDPDRWITVVAFGEYEEIADDERSRIERERARQLFEERPEWWLPAAAKTESAEHATPVVYKIRIDRMTGRRAARARAAH